MVRSLLSKVKAIEANNTMVTLGYKQFVGRSMIDVAPTLDTLKASSPATFEEYERRHSPIWQELQDVLTEHGARRYSIAAWSTSRSG